MVGSQFSLSSPAVDLLLTTFDLRSVFNIAAETLGASLGASRCVVMFSGEDRPKLQPPVEWTSAAADAADDRHVLTLCRFLERHLRSLQHALAVGDWRDSPLFEPIALELEALGITSILAVPVRHGRESTAVLIASSSGLPRQWQKAELEFAEQLAFLFGLAVENCLRLRSMHESGTERADDRYQRLVEHSDAIIFHTDARFVITFISKRAMDFFGVSPEDFVAGVPVHWFDLVHIEDRQRVHDRLLEVERRAETFDDECRVVNHITGRIRWLLTKLVPVIDAHGSLEGWDGFGIDITSRREAQAALDSQSKKVRALYTVSSAIRGYLDPGNIASRGVAALCEATGANAGICYLFPSRKSAELSLVAHHGFSADFAERVAGHSTLPSLCMYVVRNGQSVVVADIRTDPRASRVLAEEEGLLSAVLVPISVEEERLGTLGLFDRAVGKFDGGDVMLVSAAANQIGLAARQASLFSAYRKQTKNLAALYRMSRELSRFLPLEEIFQRAFSVIRDELGLKRLWLGLLNESGTRIVGQAAHGPGWKRRLVQMNVEISGRDNPIAQVIATASPVVVEDADRVFRQFGVKRLFSRLKITSVVLVPLVSEGMVMGVLAVQPQPGEVLAEEDTRLLSSLAAEIGTVLQAKRLEDRVDQAEKMRTAGLLAAGIAHNFNNLLQAILGQASLLKMQRSKPEAVEKSSTIISESAMRGAEMVKQLLSFANLEEPNYELCDVNAVIERGVKNIRRLLAENQKLVLSLRESLPRAYIDPSQVVRILGNLVSNSSQAMPTGGVIQIFSDSIIVDRASPHYEVPYGSYIRIGVRDSGVGMDEETRRRCFEPFFTTKNVDPGSGLGMTGGGLGLAVAYALARRNGGRLVVDSRPGQGALFTLYLPVGEEHPRVEGERDEFELTTAGGQLVQAEDLSRRIERISDPSIEGTVDQSSEQSEADYGSDMDWGDFD